MFRDNEIDWEVLPKLTSEDLKEIGVLAIGHRRKLLDASASGSWIARAQLRRRPSRAVTMGIGSRSISGDHRNLGL